jgi:hypothetical protein
VNPNPGVSLTEVWRFTMEELMGDKKFSKFVLVDYITHGVIPKIRWPVIYLLVQEGASYFVLLSC